MHNPSLAHEGKTGESLLSEAADQGRRKALKTVSFDQFIQIYAQQLHRHTQMISEREGFGHVHNMMLVIRIETGKVLHDLDFNHGLVIEAVSYTHLRAHET